MPLAQKLYMAPTTSNASQQRAEDDVWAACARAISAARASDPQDLAARRVGLAQLLFAPLLLPAPAPSHRSQIPEEELSQKGADAHAAVPILTHCTPPAMRCAGAPPPPGSPAVPRTRRDIACFIDEADADSLETLEQRLLALMRAMQCLLALITDDGPAELEDEHQKLRDFNALRQELEATMLSDGFSAADVASRHADCIQVMMDMFKPHKHPSGQQYNTIDRLFDIWQGLQHPHADSPTSTTAGHDVQDPATQKQAKLKSSTRAASCGTSYAAQHPPSLVQQKRTPHIINNNCTVSLVSNRHASNSTHETAAGPSARTTNTSRTAGIACEDKLETTKRKLHLGYGCAQEAKRQHSIRILHTDQMPLPRPASKKPMSTMPRPVCKAVSRDRPIRTTHQSSMGCHSEADVVPFNKCSLMSWPDDG